MQWRINTSQIDQKEIREKTFDVIKKNQITIPVGKAIEPLSNTKPKKISKSPSYRTLLKNLGVEYIVP